MTTTLDIATDAALVAGRNITVRHGRRVALDDVSLEVATGERVVICGRSGSGKTTLLHVLGGLLQPSAGSVAWKGSTLACLDQATRDGHGRRGIAYVFQSPSLLPYFSAVENIRFAARQGANDEATTLLGLVGLQGKSQNLPQELSGGEQQRVAVARALAQQPQLLLCDEPTGHLDSDTATRVLDLIDALQQRLGFALVMASHDGDLISRFERRVMLEDGRLVRQERS